MAGAPPQPATVRAHSRTFEWRFSAPPETIWPALADTARFNEAAGLPRHAIDERPQPDGSVRYFAAARKAGLTLAWEEIPVEWVWGRWFRHLRVFSRGPFRSLCATFELADDGTDGTTGRYTVEVEPAGLLGRALIGLGALAVIERNFSRLAEDAGAWAEGLRERPFDPPDQPLTAAMRDQGRRLIARIAKTPEAHGLAERLAGLVADGLDLDVARIRPLALARHWQVPPRAVVALCLRAVVEGYLEQRWDLLCPRCRGAKLTVTALDRLPTQAHCGACNIAYDRDFARNVELAFRPAPRVRPLGDGEFCLFGPMTTPHIAVQVRLAAGEERRLAAEFAPGAYRLRTLEIGGASEIEHPGGAFPAVIAEEGSVRSGAPAVAGSVLLVNREDRPRTLIVESRAWAEDALTAHRATTLQAFRDLFPGAALAPADAVAIAKIGLLFTDLAGSTALYERIGDTAAYTVVGRHFAVLSAAVRAHDGAVVKTMGDAVMAAFAEPADAVRAAIAIQRAHVEPPVKVGVHAGACVAVTLNGRLDYFGSTVNLAARLQAQAAVGEVVLSEAITADEGVAAILAGHRSEPRQARLRGFAEPVGYRAVSPVRS